MLFADGKNLTDSGDSKQDVLAVGNSVNQKMLIANKLSINVAKSEFMLIGSKQMIKKDI